MTRIEFFFNVEDKLQKIAELCGSAVRKGRRHLVYSADPETTVQLES